MEKFKTILLIVFIAGVVGAFNTIIRLSQSNNESPLDVITTALGLTPKKEPEPGRKLDYVLSELNSQPVYTTVSQPNQPSPSMQPQTVQTTTVRPTPTPTPNAIKTTLELPPLPPIGGSSLGESTQTPELPPLPPIHPAQEPDTMSSFDKTLKNIAAYFGF